MPITAILPLVIGFAHKYGYLKWVNPNWFSYRWLKYKYKQWHEAKKNLFPVALNASLAFLVGEDLRPHFYLQAEQ